MYRDGNDAIDKKNNELSGQRQCASWNGNLELRKTKRLGKGSGTLLCPEADRFIKEELAKDKSSKVKD